MQSIDSKRIDKRFILLVILLLFVIFSVSMLSYVALTGLAFEGVSFYVGFHPTLVYFAPSRLALWSVLCIRDKSRLAWCVYCLHIGSSFVRVCFVLLPSFCRVVAVSLPCRFRDGRLMGRLLLWR